jgi:LacI family transcriptional regulator
MAIDGSVARQLDPIEADMARNRSKTGVVELIKRENRIGRKVVVVGQQLMSVTRQALLDGVLTLVISVPLERVAMDATKGMALAVEGKSEAGTYTSVLPFEIYTRENI